MWIPVKEEETVSFGTSLEVADWRRLGSEVIGVGSARTDRRRVWRGNDSYKKVFSFSTVTSKPRRIPIEDDENWLFDVQFIWKLTLSFYLSKPHFDVDKYY